MKKVLGMGNALVDILVSLPDESALAQLGLAKGSMQLVDASFSERVLSRMIGFNMVQQSGGSASNTVHGLSALGVPCSFVGKVGDDEFGTVFERNMVAHGVLPHLFHGELPTGRAIALISPDSERTFATYLGSAVTLTADELSADLFRGFDLFHVEGYLTQDHCLIERSLQLAHELGLMISFDLASFNVVAENLGFLQEMVAQYVDILFANEEEARSFTGLEARQAVENIGRLCECAVVKTGRNGSLIANDGNIIEVPAKTVRPVDTTGAGDLYAAGFLYGFVNGMPLEKCGRIGTIAASSVIEIIGAKLPAERWSTIKEEISRI
ncbi:adenosine kinase [bacterium]|nr:adenosine kinase [bacterium]MBR6245331.1 adenosine kinase [bacterium]